MFEMSAVSLKLGLRIIRGVIAKICEAPIEDDLQADNQLMVCLYMYVHKKKNTFVCNVEDNKSTIDNTMQT